MSKIASLLTFSESFLHSLTEHMDPSPSTPSKAKAWKGSSVICDKAKAKQHKILEKLMEMLADR